VPRTTEEEDREGGPKRRSLATEAARNLATTTKTPPQMQGISPRWLLRVLPWVPIEGGTYRVNRRLLVERQEGRIAVVNVGAAARVVPGELSALPLFRGFDDAIVLETLASRFVQTEHGPDEAIVRAGEPADGLIVVAHGKVRKLGKGKYGADAVLGILVDGDHLGGEALRGPTAPWAFSATAATRTTVLRLSRAAFEDVLAASSGLRRHVEAMAVARRRPANRWGEAAIEIASGHSGEPSLPETFVDYELSPREHELSVAQTTLRIHTRVADLYNLPMNQVAEQLRLVIEALRERQEHDLVNHREFGLLHQAAYGQRFPTGSGPPTPGDLDELVTRRRKAQVLVAHPLAIAAFGRQCNRLGLYPTPVEWSGQRVHGWRGIPILPCDKIPITETRTTSILVMRLGEENQGVVGLRPATLPDEHQPGLSVRFMGVDDQAMISYLVSAYYSAALLVPDALGVLEDVEIGR